MEDVIYYNYKNTGRPTLPGEDIVFWSHYQDEKNTPLYAFGHGLSYTTFKYDNLKIENTFSENKTVTVSVDVTNTGELKGKEVVQLYIRDLFASITRPVKELKGFELVELDPNQTKTITLSLTQEELGFFNNQGLFIVEDGDFEVFVGGSSETVLTDKFKL